MTPTPEQIAAAARAIFENMSDIDGDAADWIHFRDECMEWAKAALTAAAEVGDKRWQEVANQGIHIETELRKELLTIEAATIERCAQVADEYFNDPDPYVSRKIAAAIRALKDKP